MGIEICAVGGYQEIGKNMTAIKVDDEVILIDMGIHLENYIRYTEDEDIHGVSAAELIKVGAIPDISVINDWKDKVKAIVPTHAHLDHTGAIPFLSNKFKAPILCTPFTAAVIKAIEEDERSKIKNRILRMNINSKYHISDKITLEFINMTHSTPQTVLAVLHTPYGSILYANDFKFDRHPTLGKATNFEKLEEIGKKGVIALIVDSLYAPNAMKTPSEMVAKEMLNEVMLGTNSKGKAVIVTTFSSHLARLKSIVEFGRKMNRKVLFLGRSLYKYVNAGEEAEVINFKKKAEIVKFGKQIRRKLASIEKNGERDKYLFVVTGHQGEPKATLSKMVDKELPFEFLPEDHVIFSCKVIPNKLNIENREELERKLKKYGVRIFKDIHVSGHASREDLRDFLHMLKPKHIFPAHGEKNMMEALKELSGELGYDLSNNVHLLKNHQRITL
ncbi:RNase J family beta-CASP ribonuclease [Candidatus Woesearchaeota archaeon]|nr:RNase J family beta-CASP ribonuclease [Candidatus Woesearchaeota archaeon]